MPSTQPPPRDAYSTMRDLHWSPKEKDTARRAFDRALHRELEATIREAKQMAAKIKEASELWELLRARLALNQGNLAKAIELLSVASGNELGSPRTTLHANFGALYPVYMRGEAYLAARRGSEAAAEFQKILNHRGVVASDPVGAVAQLQLARAYAKQSDPAKARSAYQAFLTL